MQAARRIADAGGKNARAADRGGVPAFRHPESRSEASACEPAPQPAALADQSPRRWTR